MTEPEFQYGPVAKAIYIALLWFTVVFAFIPDYAHLLFYYIPFLIFLGIGLRPLLVHTGLYRHFSQLNHKLDEARYAELSDKRRKEIEKADRIARYKNQHQRHRDKDLPPNW